MKIHSLAVLLAIITASVDTTGAKEVVNPCNICPNGATAGDDVAPHAEDGDPITCKELIEAAKLFETGTYWCGVYEMNEQTCCPPTEQPVDPCTICPNGITVADEIHTDFGCSDLVGLVSLWESESNFCKIGGEVYESMCCPTVAESPCVICPDGATAGDDFKPYEDVGGLISSSPTPILTPDQTCVMVMVEKMRLFAAPPRLHRRLPATSVQGVPPPVMTLSHFHRLLHVAD